MKITVLNGSPKGQLSVTMQYINYIKKKFPDHEIQIIDISLHIKKIESDKKAFSDIINAVRSSKAVIWATPVYYLLVPAQYKRFIELIFERAAQAAFKGKYAAVMVTSIHFFDHTSRNYLNAISDDLDMNFVGSFTPDMYDLMSGKNRAKLISFADDFFRAVETGAPTERAYAPVSHRPRAYKPGKAAAADPGGNIIAVITDCSDPESNIGKMVQRFSAAFSGRVKIVAIAEMDARAGCTGCCRCGLDNICIHNDNFAESFDAHVKTADILVFAGEIKDRYFSSLWKMFFDRSFYNGHVPMFPKRQIGLLVSGPLSQNPNLREIFEAMVEMQGSNLAGVVSDEYDSPKIDRLIDALAGRLVSFAANGYIRPESFLGMGGKKIFRDAVWGRLRFVFQKDHEYYKKHGGYDFPQKDYRMRRLNAIMMFMTSIPSFRKEIRKRIPAEMVKPLQSVVKNK
ncbi:MAG TPA: NAD(P)H-dependent oxidoreductase [Spirochaetota bacterium]|nr:NAD(P)H-dependent oxidoreductase [Spirochaetota bacterium]HPI90564.1 NAD(P)H-dependent oxidoreductase [Spirochaetota bacterium]HPR49256.1 NAD(P)H-dependent oxidoreductase [Spirochaetota bacterium]